MFERSLMATASILHAVQDEIRLHRRGMVCHPSRTTVQRFFRRSSLDGKPSTLPSICKHGDIMARHFRASPEKQANRWFIEHTK